MAHPLFALLGDLEDARIHYSLARSRPDTVRVDLTLTGKRVEIDVFADGHMEVSEFVGSEAVIGDANTVKTIIDSHRT